MYVIKRGGKKERFDQRKVYASCYAACLSTSMNKRDAEKICEKVAVEVKRWIKKKKEATSDQIFKEIVKGMKKQDRNAAFMYETHRDVS
ncbi:MAG: hypothetical protein HYW25_01400 [Candidatus Aenigmarchaeota archaeon]|nr:hypothetical protein [Candidatus Aenigmarchaeota archaeon]